MREEEIKFSAYRCKTNTTLTPPAILLNDLYEIKKKHWIIRQFSMMTLHFQRVQL